MAIKSSSVLVGSTAVTLTGGSAHTMEQDSKVVPGGIHVVDTAVSDFTVRPHSTFSAVSPELLTDGTYTKGKRKVTHVRPKRLASTAISPNLIRIQAEIHPETTAAELLELRIQAVQHIMDADFDGFWSLGTVS